MSKHRKARRPVLAGVAIVPVSAMALIAGAGQAAATPTTSQPGVTSPTTSQPGVAAPSTSQPGVTTKKTNEDWKYVPGFDPGPYRNMETIPEAAVNRPATPRPAAPAAPSQSGGQQANYVAPQTQTVVEAEPELVADNGLAKPIQAEEGTVRLGVFKSAKPEWLSEEYADQLNNTSAVLEAQGATAFNSLGIPTTRSQRIAGGAVAGAAVGALIGGAVMTVPGVVVGALVGGTIGGTSGVLGCAPLVAPLLASIGLAPAGAVIGTACTVAGGLIGAGVGAGALIAAGAVVGGTIGAVVGTAYGAGENMGEAAEYVPAGFDKDALIAQTRHVVNGLETSAAGLAVTNGFRGASDAFQGALDNGRDAIAARPDGEALLAQIDNVDLAFKNIVNPGHEAGDAIGIGVHYPVAGTAPGGI
ncbi:MAG: hypothetical protein GX542_12760 [Rhodococcus sp.]|nr:hypothetical protein [Rhodococcus sp. (in: high G+C Gram-positive bacteria)]